jgi:outer membrane beta-barrel protein
MKSLGLITLSLIFISQASFAKSKIDSLGGNKELMKRAQALDPDNRKRIVQKRSVDRTWRMEFSGSYGLFSGGDPYLNTSAMGLNADVHINPNWSVGVRYYDHRNELSGEGKRIYDQAQQNESVSNNQVGRAFDYPDTSAMGVISFYPLYGKINMFDMGVTQFDIYLLAGYGQMQLASGSTPTWTGGGGVGLWFSQHIASRLEVRYQNYQDEIYSGARDQDVVVASFALGFLL